uniref:adhesion G-protein coupled receptor G4-like n=1 Tax=Ciona intestinalis TaxID=7719 RepID=UPI00089DD678|nr:adhesion G-protein coupled receptor G4-like [Ciona intestinalis]|eukprot:XP_018669049.1 adhesion G-protein coupled receptor G4-like [Ciona intestinalis]
MSLTNQTNSTSIPPAKNFTGSIDYDDSNATDLVIWIGCGVSIVAVTITLITYISNRRLRVRRRHMLTINLCISLLIFYVGFVMSFKSGTPNMEGMNHTHFDIKVPMSSSCIAGAILTMAGWFFLQLWLVMHWAYLAFVTKQRAGRHISNFVIKTAVPAYGLSLLYVAILAGVDKANNHRLISPFNCLFVLIDEGFAYAFAVTSALCVTVVSACALYIIVKLTIKKTKSTVQSKLKKSRRSLIRTIMLTLAIYTLMIPLLISLVVHRIEGDASLESVQLQINLGYVMGIIAGLEGILIVGILLFQNEEFRFHWVSVFSGRDPSLSPGSIRNITRRGRSSKSNIIVAPQDMSRQQVSAVRIVPRDSNTVAMTAADEDFLSSARDTHELPITTSSSSILTILTNRRKMTAPANIENDEAVSETQSADDAINKDRSASLFNRALRNSVRRSSKTNTPPLSPATQAKTLNRYQFRDSRVSYGGDIERKSSF